MLKRINEALPGLVVSILLYGVMVELIGVWFVKDRIAYSIGVWFGIAVAVGMAINLATVIFDSVTMGDTAHATRRIVTKSILPLCSSGDFVRVIWVFSMGKPDCGFSWAAWFKNWSISSAFMGESKRKEVTI